MDCKKKTLIQLGFLLLLVPALVWNYGKSVFRFAQVSGDSSVDSKLNLKNKTRRSKQQQPETGVDLNVSAPIQTDEPSSSVVVTKSEIPDSNNSTGEADNSSKERSSEPGKFEPDLSDETYNQVRAKKPAIPSRFEGTNDSTRRRDTSQTPVSFLGLLGIPTVVFSVLFFVMWGIISGRIQRVMF